MAVVDIDRNPQGAPPHFRVKFEVEGGQVLRVEIQVSYDKSSWAVTNLSRIDLGHWPAGRS